MTVLRKLGSRVWVHGTNGKPKKPEPPQKCKEVKVPYTTWDFIGIEAPPPLAGTFNTNAPPDHLVDGESFEAGGQDRGGVGRGGFGDINSDQFENAVYLYEKRNYYEVKIECSGGEWAGWEEPGKPGYWLDEFHLGWNASARSIKIVGGDIEYRFKVNIDNQGIVSGLTTTQDAAVHDYRKVRYGWTIRRNGAMPIESGVPRPSFVTSFSAGNVLWVKRVGAFILYGRNEQTLYTSLLDSEEAILCATAFLYKGLDYIYDATLTGDTIGALNGDATASLQPIDSMAFGNTVRYGGRVRLNPLQSSAYGGLLQYDIEGGSGSLHPLM